MFTLNGTGTTIYGSAKPKPLPLFGEEAALAEELGLNPCSHQVVKWITVLFLPVVPLGTFRIVKVRQKFLTTVASQFLMERTEWDWRQIMLHYFVGWIPAFVSASLLASLAFLQTYDRQIANQLELPILMLFVFAILTAVGLLIANLFREEPMRAPAERPARKPGDASITKITTLPKAQFGTTVRHDRLSLAVQKTEQAHDAILVDPPAPITIQTGQVSVVKIIAISMAVLMMVAFMVCSGLGFLLFRINQNAANSNPPIIIPEAQVPQSGLPPLELNPATLPITVPSSQKAVTLETELHQGDPLQAEWAGDWYRAEVLQLLSDGQVRIRWIDWGPEWDETMERTRLQLPTSDEKTETNISDDATKQGP